MQKAICIFQKGRDLIIEEFWFDKKDIDYEIEQTINYHYDEKKEPEIEDSILHIRDYFDNNIENWELKSWFRKE